MADSVGSGFPSTGINKGHVFYDFDEQSLWMYLGGVPRLVSSWIMLNGRLTSQPDTSLWGFAQAGAMWFLVTDRNVYVWDGTQIVVDVTGSNPSLYNYQTSVKYQNDFLFGVTLQDGIYTNGGSYSARSPSANTVGAAILSTSAVINTIASVFLGTAIEAYLGSSIHTVIWLVQLNNNDVNTTQRVGSIRAGGTSDPPTDGIYIEKLDADVNWFCVTRNGGVQTRVDSGISVTTSYKTFKYVRDANGVQFSISGVNVGGVITTNITAIDIRPAVQIVNSIGLAKTMDIDYMEFTLTGLTRA